MGLDEVEYLHEYHMSGPERIWGIREGNICLVLWCAPDHSVWPT
jgi:hypothetical protein